MASDEEISDLIYVYKQVIDQSETLMRLANDNKIFLLDIILRKSEQVIRRFS